MPDVVRRFVEHRLAVVFLVTGPAQDPQVAHAQALGGAFLRWGAEARFPSHSLRLSRGQRMPERAALRTVSKEGNRHLMIMP